MTEVSTFSTLRTEIAGVSVHDLVAAHGTPVYVYDAEKIRQRIADLERFDVVRYAQKANSNLAILDLVRRQGGLVDSVSAWEIRRALKAGFATRGEPAPIVYTADIFDHEALDLCVQHNIHVNCGSPDMIDQLGARVAGVEITLRINPGFGHGHSRKTNTGGEQSKHGIWYEQIGDCLARAERHDLRITGLHMHIGSGTDLEHLGKVCAEMERAAREIGPSISTISAGGGLPVRYQESDSYVDLDAYYQLWSATRSRLQNDFGHPVTLEIEPGRYLVAESGYLIAEIRAIKENGNNRFYVLDAGFNNLSRPILYGAYHPMSIVPAEGDGAERPNFDVVVGGPLCESGDIFTQEDGGFVVSRNLPDAKVGEHLVIEGAGAYAAVMASNYNSKPMAPEVLIDEGRAHLVRKRQSFDDLIAGESIPSAESS